jgi:hypothetical protein
MTAAVKDKPILFSSTLATAIDLGEKTQTRRLMNPQPRRVNSVGPFRAAGWKWKQVEFFEPCLDLILRCPYGEVGDRLYVRESVLLCDLFGNPCKPAAANCAYYRDGGHLLRRTGKYTAAHRHESETKWPDGAKWTPSILAERWTSRLTVEVTDIRAERLHDISDEDMRAEGIGFYMRSIGWKREYSLRGSFRVLWDKINGKRCPWDSNPWLWVLTFRKVER